MKGPAHTYQALPCAAVVCTVYKHTQLQKLACLLRKHEVHIRQTPLVPLPLHLFPLGTTTQVSTAAVH